ncbi:7874_t:CDS:2 [Scutellospora calospora]|uniref:7874_t:CDS:1 n=1 Tax=Scutellospora calospora TaxID=85575 RepID=A0ACA9K3F6_9GLOM|nr:7874_t:CDS:2 [Scutellospora calospora]
MGRLTKRKVHSRKVRVQRITKRRHQIEVSETCSSSSDKLNDVEDREISILRSEEADNMITRLMQTVSEMNKHINMDNYSMSDTISSDSDSEIFGSDSEVKTAKSHNIMSLEYLNNTIKQLEKEIKSNKHSEVVKARLYTMLFYFHLVEHGHKRIEASIIVVGAAGKGVYHAHCIRAWAINYIKNSEFPISRQGKHPKTWSFLWDDDNVNSDELAKHVNEKILPKLCFDPSPTICIRTARNWLKTFEFKYSEVRKGMYMDRHECADVVAYHERFLERIAEFETCMVVFSGENMEEETRPDFDNIIILVAFPNLPSEVCVITYLGKDGDGWWNSDDLALFAFDNTTGHCAYAEDALLAKNMNLSPYGKQPKMRSTTYGDNIPQDI